jgi:thiaminase/transcriptional activator TenA
MTTTTTSMSARVRAMAEPIWQAQFDHPFVRGLGDGTLPFETFGNWLRQDYVYLIEYGRLFAYAAGRAPDLATMNVFAKLLYDMTDGEMALHKSYTAEFGITVQELEQVEKWPTCQGYTDFLLRTATIGDYPELIAALLPCMWGYSDLGIHLFNQGLPDEERYARWITAYASQEFADLTKWTCDLLDRLSEGAPEAAQRRIEHAFITSARYELAFWEMAWAGEKWPEEK